MALLAVLAWIKKFCWNLWNFWWKWMNLKKLLCIAVFNGLMFS